MLFNSFWLVYLNLIFFHMTFIYWTLYEQLILFEDYILTKGCFRVAYFIAENIF